MIWGALAALLAGGVFAAVVDRDVRCAFGTAVETIVIGPFWLVASTLVWLWQFVPGHDRVTWFRGHRLSTRGLNRFTQNTEARAFVVTWRWGAFVVLRASKEKNQK